MQFPVLWHGGHAVPDSSAIIDYLFSTYPEQMAVLSPPDDKACASPMPLMPQADVAPTDRLSAVPVPLNRLSEPAFPPMFCAADPSVSALFAVNSRVLMAQSPAAACCLDASVGPGFRSCQCPNGSAYVIMHTYILFILGTDIFLVEAQHGSNPHLICLEFAMVFMLLCRFFGGCPFHLALHPGVLAQCAVTSTRLYCG